MFLFLAVYGVTVGLAYSVYSSYECTSTTHAHAVRQVCSGETYFTLGSVLWFVFLIAGARTISRRHSGSHKYAPIATAEAAASSSHGPDNYTEDADAEAPMAPGSSGTSSGSYGSAGMAKPS